MGGRVSAVGAVIGALTLTLAGSFLTFLRLSPDWQIGAQGAILIIVNYTPLMPGGSSNWYLLGGLGLVTLGFITATKWE